MVKDYIDIRAVFSKEGRAVFISHLDLMRTMQRAFKRAKIPVWHTKGYNPHVYIMFPLALSLGAESECEIMDFGINMDTPMTPQEVADRLNSTLPQGLKVVRAYTPQTSHKLISAAEYEISFLSAEPAKLSEELKNYLSQQEIPVEKKTKKGGVTAINLKEHIKNPEVKAADDRVLLKVALPAGVEININPQLLIDSFLSTSGAPISNVSVKRTKILDLNGNIFI